MSADYENRIQAATDRWVASMVARRRRTSRERPSMAPWDEFAQFDNPRTTQIVLALNAQGIQIVPTEPRRVGLIISAQAGGQAFISPFNETAAQTGIIIQSTTLPYAIFQSDWGNLVQVAWFANCQATTTLYVVEILLRGLEW